MIKSVGKNFEMQESMIGQLIFNSHCFAIQLTSKAKLFPPCLINNVCKSIFINKSKGF